MDALEFWEVQEVAHPFCVGELGEGLPLPGLKFRERFDKEAEGLGKALGCEGAECLEDIPEEGAVVGTLLDESERGRASHPVPEFDELPCQETAKEGANADTGVEVACAAGALPGGSVIAFVRMVKCLCHEAGKGHWALGMDALGEQTGKA